MHDRYVWYATTMGMMLVLIGSLYKFHRAHEDCEAEPRMACMRLLVAGLMLVVLAVLVFGMMVWCLVDLLRCDKNCRYNDSVRLGANMAKANSEAPLIIGVDFGGVLSKHDGSKEASVDGIVLAKHDGIANAKEHKNTTIDMPDALVVLQSWKAAGHRLYLVSHCGKTRAQETADALAKTCPGLFDATYFTKSAAAKANVLLHLGCHLMIDDRKDVLDHIGQHAPSTVTYLFDPVAADGKTAWSRLNVWLTTFVPKVVVPDGKAVAKYCYATK